MLTSDLKRNLEHYVYGDEEISIAAHGFSEEVSSARPNLARVAGLREALVQKLKENNGRHARLQRKLSRKVPQRTLNTLKRQHSLSHSLASRLLLGELDWQRFEEEWQRVSESKVDTVHGIHEQLSVEPPSRKELVAMLEKFFRNRNRFADRFKTGSFPSDEYSTHITHASRLNTAIQLYIGDMQSDRRRAALVALHNDLMELHKADMGLAQHFRDGHIDAAEFARRADEHKESHRNIVTVFRRTA
jgi:hypothetical protein